MTLERYEFRPLEPEKRIICVHLDLVGLLPGRAVVFIRHAPTLNKRLPRGLLSDILEPAFFSVIKVAADNVFFGNGNPAQNLIVPIKAIMENGLGGHFYDVAEWWQWQVGHYEDVDYKARRQKGQLEHDKALLVEILSSNFRIVTEAEAEKLGLKPLK